MKNDYSIEKRIGGGRFTDVYMVVKKSSGTKYALKLVEPDDQKPPHNSRVELKILLNLREGSNQHVTELMDNFQNCYEIGFLFPLYQLDLNQLVKLNCKTRTKFDTSQGVLSKIKENKMDAEEIVTIFKGILDGLAYVHSKGIINRDINPNNIMFQADQLTVPIIIDFGISFQQPDNFGSEPFDSKITDIATGFYKAPELLLAIKDYNETVDIWSTGVILMLMSSENGEVPYTEDAQYSDLSLLSNIVGTFGSPPVDWSDAKSSRTFKALNENFFTKTRKGLDVLIPKLKDDPRIVNTFQNMMVYESSQRLSAAELLKLL